MRANSNDTLIVNRFFQRDVVRQVSMNLVERIFLKQLVWLYAGLDMLSVVVKCNAFFNGVVIWLPNNKKFDRFMRNRIKNET